MIRTPACRTYDPAHGKRLGMMIMTAFLHTLILLSKVETLRKVFIKEHRVSLKSSLFQECSLIIVMDHKPFVTQGGQFRGCSRMEGQKGLPP